MNLKTFVKQAICDFVGAAQEAEEELSREIRPPAERGNIHFDVAVTIEDTKSGGAGIKILQIAQGDLSSEMKNSTTSRISFSYSVSPLNKSEMEKVVKESSEAANAYLNGARG